MMCSRWRLPDLLRELPQVTIPLEKPGLSNVGSSKRVNEDAKAALRFLCHPGWPKKSTPEVQLIKALILMLLVPYILTDHRLVATDLRNEVNPRPAMLPHKMTLFRFVWKLA